MPKKSIKTSLPSDFEPKKKNPLSLGDDSNLDNDLKSLNIGDLNTGIEISKDIVHFAKPVTTFKETTEELFVTKIKGNATGSPTVPNFIFQNVNPTEENYGLGVNIMEDGMTALMVSGDTADLAIQSEQGIFIQTGADDGDMIFFRRGTNWFSPDSTTFKFDMYNSDFYIYDRSDANDYFKMDVGSAGATSISTVDDGGATAHLTLDVDGDITLDSHTGVFIAKKAGTEFSAADSSYAGMILGYTRVFDSDASVFQTTTTSHVNLNKNFDSADHFLKVTFVIPPSNKFEIEVFLPYISGADSFLELGLATDESATALDDKYSNRVWDVDETDFIQIRHTWFVDGSDHSWAAGQSRTIYATVKHGDTGCRIYLGNGTIALGGWVMQVRALPATIGDGT